MTELASLPPDDRQFLVEAAAYLERPRFLMKVANLVGKPAEVVMNLLPDSAQKSVAEATQKALRRALDWAIRTLPEGERVATPLPPLPAPPEARQSFGQSARRFVSKHSHTAMAATSGAVGGMFGLAGAAVEIPASTLVMLRSIARIAAENGADLNDPTARLHCLTVFSLGSTSLDKMDSAYLTTRLGLILALQESAALFARHSASEIAQALAKGTAPMLVQLIDLIAKRFQVLLTQKVAAQAVPVVGAATGAAVNAAFTDHFNRVARYHFGVVRLEWNFGRDLVQNAYREACQGTRALDL